MKKAALFIALIGALSACNTIHSVARDANTAVQAWNDDYQKQNNRYHITPNHKAVYPSNRLKKTPP